MIKGLCTVSTGSVVNLLIDGEMPKVGHYYYLESATEGTTAQNKTFHALTMEYFNSGQSSYDAANYADFKNQIKRHLGQGFECYIYATFDDDMNVIIKEVKTAEDIPSSIKNSEIYKDQIRGKLKSWSDYTKKQRKNTIDNVISEMHQAGINTPKFEEILKGMQSEKQQ